MKGAGSVEYGSRGERSWGPASPAATLLVRATPVVVGLGATTVWQFWLSGLVSRRLGGRGQ